MNRIVSKRTTTKVIYAQQIEGIFTDESSPHYCVYIWLEHIGPHVQLFVTKFKSALRCIKALSQNND